MHDLIQHLLATNADEIVKRSRLHCHARGLHSIMLLEAPGKTIRLFVAEEENDLWKNTPNEYRNGLSLAFHPHHCELTLSCVRGTFINWTVTPAVAPHPGNLYLTRYLYRSAISDGECSFVADGKIDLGESCFEVLGRGDAVYMPANQIHTVGIPKGAGPTAWFVFEGREDPAYQKVCYSNAKLEAADVSSLYQSAALSDVVRLLRLANLA